ncbi:MAG: type II toxin-antitoxin system YafQ family toxin [Oscillospiraceae bacterium]|nr:type II toxin-antitoxin system YafQ family toxin [Oscillospiraceae bacterium]
MDNQRKYRIVETTAYKRDRKAFISRGYDVRLLDEVVNMLAEGKTLPEKNRDHKLIGNWKGHRECHITPDWLLIYKIEKNILVLTLTRIGTHSNLFKK